MAPLTWPEMGDEAALLLIGAGYTLGSNRRWRKPSPAHVPTRAERRALRALEQYGLGTLEEEEGK